MSTMSEAAPHCEDCGYQYTGDWAMTTTDDAEHARTCPGVAIEAMTNPIDCQICQGACERPDRHWRSDYRYPTT